MQLTIDDFVSDRLWRSLGTKLAGPLPSTPHLPAEYHPLHMVNVRAQ